MILGIGVNGKRHEAQAAHSVEIQLRLISLTLNLAGVLQSSSLGHPGHTPRIVHPNEFRIAAMQQLAVKFDPTGLPPLDVNRRALIP
jgi:hypothetical protein